ncbi:MAG: sulfite exporter TauE/SafE family protein [Alphaproteobacteria bacterium]
MSDLPAIGPYLAPFGGAGSLYLGVLAMGFFYGLTLCSFACLPLVTPYVFGTQPGFRKGFEATAVFIIARVAGYTLLGALAGLAGKLVLEHVGLKAPMILAGGLVLAIGVAVALSRRNVCGNSSRIRRSSRHMTVLGFATSLMPCPPLYAIMLYAATTQSMVTGALLAFLFGCGTLASPLYYLGGAAGWLSARIGQETAHKYNSLLRILSALVIMMFGVKLIANGFGGI